MKSHRTLPAALLLCILAAACGTHPTGSDRASHPGGPSYDGGYTIGSGNSAESGGYTIGSGNVEGGGETDDGSSTTESSTETTTERGGYTIGSGN